MARQNWKDEDRWSEYRQRDLTTRANMCSCYPSLENLSLNSSLRDKIYRQPILWDLLEMVTTITKDQKEKFFTKDFVLRDDFYDFIDKEECHDSDNKLQEECYNTTSSNRLQKECYNTTSSNRLQEECHDSDNKLQKECYDSDNKLQEKCYDPSSSNKLQEECYDQSSSNRSQKEFHEFYTDNKLQELIIVLIGQDLYEKCKKRYNKWQTSTLNPRYTPAYEPYYLVTLTTRKEYKVNKQDHYVTHFTEKIPVFGSPPSPKVLIALLCSTDKWEFCHRTHNHQLYIKKRNYRIALLFIAIFLLVGILYLLY